MVEFIRYEDPISVVVPPPLPASQIRGLAQRLEELGFKNAWVAEDYFELAAFPTAGAMLGATERLNIGIGIVSSVVRHPAVTAMEIATLDGIFPGRLTAGIGHGVPIWTRQMGLFPKSTLKSLRECVQIVRRLLDGETVTQHDGHFYCDNIKLSQNSPGMKILTGIVGPKSLELSGEIADGVITSVLAGPEYIDFAKAHVSAGADKAGRTASQALPVLALYAVHADREVALSAAGHAVAHYLMAMGASPLTAPLGINDEIAQLLELGEPDAIYNEMPKDWIGKLAVAGTPEECAARIQELLDAGAAQVGLACIMADQMDEQLALTSREVMPRVQARSG